MVETPDYDKSSTPTTHKTTHQDGGSDEISVGGLSGELADEQLSSWTKLSGKPTTFTPETHHTRHEPGGDDAISLSEGLFDIDINGDIEPITENLYDQYYEIDGANDIMPKAA